MEQIYPQEIIKELKKVRRDIKKIKDSCDNFTESKLKVSETYKIIDSYIGDFQRKYKVKDIKLDEGE